MTNYSSQVPNFGPIEFEIFNAGTEEIVLKAKFFGEEIYIMDGLRTLLCITLSRKDLVWHQGPVIAKIRHPAICNFLCFQGPGLVFTHLKVSNQKLTELLEQPNIKNL